MSDEVHLYYNEQVLAEMPLAATLIADEGDYSVWYKPYGMYSQGSKWGDHCAIARWIELNIQPERPVFLMHRLDRATSGLMVFAHNKTMSRAITQLFENRTIKKSYIAKVTGDCSKYASGFAIREELDNKAAHSVVTFFDFDVIKNQSLVYIDLHTGRKHQIRRHLAGIGFPVVGDRLYGGGESVEDDLQLQAHKLKFDCPVTNESKMYEVPEALLLTKR